MVYVHSESRTEIRMNKIKLDTVTLMNLIIEMLMVRRQHEKISTSHKVQSQAKVIKERNQDRGCL
jgi:hypothetical protein